MGKIREMLESFHVKVQYNTKKFCLVQTCDNMEGIVEIFLICDSSFTDLLHMTLAGFRGFPKSHSQHQEH